MNQDINAILEMIQAMKNLAIFVHEVGEDSTVSMSDLPALIKLVSKVGEITKAVKDADEIMAEVKDLTSEEASQVVAAVVAAFNEVKNA